MIADLVAADTRLGATLRRERWFCTSLVGAVSLELRGFTPGAVSYDGYARLHRAFWSAVNVWDATRPWSGLLALQDVHGGDLEYVRQVGTDAPAPPLTVGPWSAVQRWHGLDLGGPGLQDDQVDDDEDHGHLYLARLHADGTVEIVQSSRSRGFRHTRGGSWVGTAGLDGFAVGVLTFPAAVS